VESLRFAELPARPMVIVRLGAEELRGACAGSRIEEAIAGTPADSVVQLRLEGGVPPGAERWLAASWLRSVGGERNVSVAGRSWLDGRVGTGRDGRRPASASDSAVPLQSSFRW
jgi:hypothetical protein